MGPGTATTGLFQIHHPDNIPDERKIALAVVAAAV